MADGITQPKLGLTGRWRHRERAWKVGGIFRRDVIMVIAVEVEEARWRHFGPGDPPPPHGTAPTHDDLRMVWRLANMAEVADLDPDLQVKS